MPYRHVVIVLSLFALSGISFFAHAEQPANSVNNDTSVALVDYKIQLDTIMKHDDGEFLWFHPRVAALPHPQSGRDSAVMMTIQKHLLTASDFYSGLSVMNTLDMGVTWDGPTEQPALAWQDESAEVILGVCDVMPGWHAHSKRLLAIGTQLRYSKQGKQLLDQPRSYDSAYAVYNPSNATWSPWQTIKIPDDEKFFLVAPGNMQWIVEPDGTILLPLYFRRPEGIAYETCVMKCEFDGQTLRYIEHGNEMTLDVERGLCEPSIVKYQGKYFLTLRNDLDTYVTVSDEGLHYAPIKPWQFDDGISLGTYNTQQHWLAHTDGLFLVYNRKGADNDHVTRHRAPLFIAQVDPKSLNVIRASERVLVPNRGATLGNFGAAAVSSSESWVSVSEGIFKKGVRKYGADGSTFVARIIWEKPNQRFSLTVPAN